MKKIIYLLGLVLVTLFSGCKEGTDFDIQYTPLAPVGGQYKVNIIRGYDPSKTDAEYWASNPTDCDTLYKTDGSLNKTVMYAYFSNTSDYDTDKGWIRLGNYNDKGAYGVNAKVNVDMSNYTFSGTNLDNMLGNLATATDHVTISGKCGHNTYTTVSGTVTDEIYFIYSRDSQPGYHYKAEGFKYTGWSEDTK